MLHDSEQSLGTCWSDPYSPFTFMPLFSNPTSTFNLCQNVSSWNLIPFCMSHFHTDGCRPHLNNTRSPKCTGTHERTWHSEGGATHNVSGEPLESKRIMFIWMHQNGHWESGLLFLLPLESNPKSKKQFSTQRDSCSSNSAHCPWLSPQHLGEHLIVSQMLFWLSSALMTDFTLAKGTTFTRTAYLQPCGLNVKCTPGSHVFEHLGSSCWGSQQVGEVLGGRALPKEVVTGVWLRCFITWTSCPLPASSLARMYGGEKSQVHMPTLWWYLATCSLHRGLYHLKMLGGINPSFLLLLLTRHLVTKEKRHTQLLLCLVLLYLAADFVQFLTILGQWHQSENYIVIPETMYRIIFSHNYNSVNNVNFPNSLYCQILS